MKVYDTMSVSDPDALNPESGCCLIRARAQTKIFYDKIFKNLQWEHFLIKNTG